MALPYIGEIRMFAGNFAPRGWDFCSGKLLPISGFEALYQLIGTYYGGDGESTFALPDLRGRLPIHKGNGFVLAQTGGAEEVTLTSQQMPVHTHAMLASVNSGSNNSPAGAVIGQSPSLKVLINDAPGVNLAASAIIPVGGSQPHTNFQPYLCLSFIIATEGLFPSPT